MNIRRCWLAAVAAVLATGACSSASEGTMTTAAPQATTTAVPTASTLPPSVPTPSTLPPSTAQVVQGIEELDHFAPFEPGARYSLDPDADPSTAMRVVYEIPAEGWTRWNGAAKFADDGHVAVTITTVLNLVRHGCLDHLRVDPPVGPSVDDLATALTELAPFLVTSPPKNVSISGYQGKHLELTVPHLPADHEGDAPFTECLDGSLKSWVAPFDDEAPDAFYGYTGPGYVEEFWLLDVDGTRLMIAAERSADSPPANIAEMREILDSIRIEPGGFPTGVFAGLDEEPVSAEQAAELQGLIDSWAEGEQGGLTATLITPAGTWSGAAGTAAGDRAMTPNDQMAIASVTKTVVAAQVMQLVEAGELRLGDLAADRLPADLEFDTNGATIDDLLSMRSGIPDWVDPVFWESLSTDPLHAWTAEEVLALVGPERTPVGQVWNYSSTNYALLGLIRRTRHRADARRGAA